MKSKSLLIAAIALLTPTLAFAGEKNSADVDIDQPVTVASTELAAGHYKVKWDGNGPDVTVSFSEGKKTILTALARVRSNPASQSEIVTDDAVGGTPMLNIIDVKRISIHFENTIVPAAN
jgi:hypothetical protein